MSLSQQILEALQQAGKDIHTLTRDDLVTFDELHIRGREGTRTLAQLANLLSAQQVLDIGCGVGGPARTIAAEFGCTVTGLDLNEGYCEAAQTLTELVNLKITFRQGSALDLPFADQIFDVVWMQHVQMNIEDKPRLYSESYRVLCPGGILVLHEVFAGVGGEPYYPVPWAETAATSFMMPPTDAIHLMQQTGFEIQSWNDVTEFSLNWFKKRVQRYQPSLLDQQLLLGENTGEKYNNMVRNLDEQRIVIIEAVMKAQSR
jgi:ubiquinone/menaquinone biosynthesis C-methylase UbiE